jgi:DNA-binding MarR family transcriptional regulator
MAANHSVVGSMGHLVWRVAVKWRAELDRALAPFGLTSAQYGVLASLYGMSMWGAQPSQRALAEFVGFGPMFVSNLARALERAGLVERRSDESDPRALQLKLTARGVEVVQAARAIVVDLEERRLGVLGGSSSTRAAELKQTLLTLLDDTSISGEPASSSQGPSA